MHIVVQEGVMYVHGEVTMHTLCEAAYQQCVRQALEHNVHTVDLQGVQRADSACVSLLLAILRVRPNEVRFGGIPSAVLDLAKLYDIQDWITYAR